MKSYDAIIIGSGGGAKMASALAQLGRRVAVIEKDQAGGTCLNRGCIPSKMLIHPSNLAQKIRTLHKLHINAELRGVDFAALTESINTYTDGISDTITQRYEQVPNVDYFNGAARFTGHKTVALSDTEITAETIVIATGSRPLVPDIPGLAGTPYMTSTEALRLRTLPKRLIVIGGGYIAAELGGAYAGFGCEVTFLLRSTFLRREDSDIVDVFAKEFAHGTNIHTHTAIQHIVYRNGLFTVQATNADDIPLTVEADALLVATGVLPNADELGLENTDVKVRPDGFIEVDDYLQTTTQGIYAMGDVAGNYLFRHSVNFEVEYWVEANVLADKPYPIQYPPVASAVFTHPEIASVGLTETQAMDDNRAVIIGKALYTSCAMSVARGLDHGLVKLIFDRESARLFGAHIVGEEASTMIQECVLALTAGMTMNDMYRQLYIHPAFPEVIRNALRDAIRQHDPKRAVLF